MDDPAAGRTQVSVNGGEEPLWAHTGREMFFRSNRIEVMVVPVTTGETFTAGQPRTLFRAPDMGSDGFHASYDVTADDRRFVMIDQRTAESSNPVLVLNWLAELRERTQGR
jgi:hypothetical protein